MRKYYLTELDEFGKRGAGMGMERLFSMDEKREAVTRTFAGESVHKVAADFNTHRGMIWRWQKEPWAKDMRMREAARQAHPSRAAATERYLAGEKPEAIAADLKIERRWVEQWGLEALAERKAQDVAKATAPQLPAGMAVPRAIERPAPRMEVPQPPRPAPPIVIDAPPPRPDGASKHLEWNAEKRRWLYPDELKLRTVERYTAGEHPNDLARELQISPAQVYQWIAALEAKRPSSSKLNVSPPPRPPAPPPPASSSPEAAPATLSPSAGGAGKEFYSLALKKKAIAMVLEDKLSVGEVCRRLGIKSKDSVLNWVGGSSLGGRTSYDPEVKRQAVERYRAGETATQLAAEYGCSEQSIHNWFRELSIPQALEGAGRGKGEIVPEDVRRAAMELWIDGATATEAAALADTGSHVLFRWLRNAGIWSEGRCPSLLPPAMREWARGQLGQYYATREPPTVASNSREVAVTTEVWAQRRAIVERWAAGESPIALAKEFNLTTVTSIYTWAAKFGIKRPPNLHMVRNAPPAPAPIAAAPVVGSPLLVQPVKPQKLFTRWVCPHCMHLIVPMPKPDAGQLMVLQFACPGCSKPVELPD